MRTFFIKKHPSKKFSSLEPCGFQPILKNFLKKYFFVSNSLHIFAMSK